MKIWLDDCRDPLTHNPGRTDRAMKVLLKHGREDWTWVKSVDKAKELIAQGNINVLSCDNSLGTGVVEGWTLLDWLEEKAFTDKDFPIPEYIYVHSSDTNRVVSMLMAIANIKKYECERNR